MAVINANEIQLDGTLYPIEGPVQRLLASIDPGTVVVGESVRDSKPHAHPLAEPDWPVVPGLATGGGRTPGRRAAA